MMATGVRRAFPLAVNWMSPSARGPFETVDLRPNCAHPSSTTIKTAASRVTAATVLRYNHERRGEAPMEVNDIAPAFTTTDENGEEVSLKDFRGKTVVLFFYPKADTPG